MGGAVGPGRGGRCPPWCVGPWCRTRARSVSDQSEQIRRPADNASRAQSGDEPAVIVLPGFLPRHARVRRHHRAGSSRRLGSPVPPTPPRSRHRLWRSPHPFPGLYSVSDVVHSPLRLWRSAAELRRVHHRRAPANRQVANRWLSTGSGHSLINVLGPLTLHYDVKRPHTLITTTPGSVAADIHGVPGQRGGKTVARRCRFAGRPLPIEDPFHLPRTVTSGCCCSADEKSQGRRCCGHWCHCP